MGGIFAYLATVSPAPYDAATQAGIAASEAAQERSSRFGSRTDRTTHIDPHTPPRAWRVSTDAEPRIPRCDYAVL